MSKYDSSKVSPGDLNDQPLLKLESSSMFNYGGPVTTMQFYTGDPKEAAIYLRQRLVEVARVNPWIGSKLVKDPKQHGKLLAMRYSKDSPPIDEMFEIDTELQIHEELPYIDLVAKVSASKAHLPNGNTLLKTGQNICKLTLAPKTDSSGFAVIFSMSHSVGDGFTYYSILNMLSSNVEPSAMDPVRNESLRKGLPAQVGEKEYKFMVSPGVCAICHYIGVAIKAKKNPPQCFYLDKEKLKMAKEIASAEPGAAPFVSTNDIVTSGFARATKSKMITMAMDFRGRLEGLTTKHAGNYHLGLLFGPDGFATANSIRNALNSPPPLSRAVLPGCCMTGNWSATISNWSSMSKGNLDIPDCTQTLHLPYVDPKEAMADTCVVFKARPGEVAALFFLQNTTVDDLKKELPLGDLVSTGMFGGK